MLGGTQESDPQTQVPALLGVALGQELNFSESLSPSLPKMQPSCATIATGPPPGPQDTRHSRAP